MVSPGEKTLKKKKRKTSKGSKDYYVRDKTGKSVCALCGATLHGSTGGRRDSEVRKLAKTKRRASVPFGGVLCTKCRRVVAEEKAKLEAGLKEDSQIDLNIKKFVVVKEASK